MSFRKVNVFVLIGILQFAEGNNIIDVKKHDLLDTVNGWGPEFTISFDVNVASFDNADSTDVDEDGNRYADYLHFASGRDECCSMGDRYPVFRTVSNGSFYFATAFNDVPNHEYWSPPQANIRTNTWYSIEVKQALINSKWRLTFSVKFGSTYVPLLTLSSDSQPRSYETLNVFSGMCTAAKANIRNLNYYKMPECGNGFKKWQNKCYLYLEQVRDWDYVSQPDACSYWNSKSQLVSIHSQEENDYVYSLFNYKNGLNAWTGGYLNPDTGAWAWLDGSAFDYSNWAPGEPTGVAPQKIMMYGRAGPEPGKWADETPSTKVFGYVCSYNLFENNG